MQRVRNWLVLSSLLLLVALEANPQSNGLPNIAVPVYLVNGVSGDISLGLQTINTAFSLDPASNATTTVLTNDQYRIQIAENPTSSYTTFHVEVDSLSGQPIQLNEVGIQLRFPRGNVDSVWSPALPANIGEVEAADSETPIAGGSHPNFGVPYIASAAVNGQNIVNAGVLRQDTDVFIYGFPAGTNEYIFRLWIPQVRTGTQVNEDFLVGTDPTMNWFDAAQQYSDWVDTSRGYQPFPLTANCYEPIYDTWYWSLDQVDAELYAEAAGIASSLNMGMFIADAGWDAPPGEFAKGLFGETGNYSPPANEFANINDTFSTIRQDQLGYLLWIQPFAVGEQSTRYPATKNLHVVTPADPSRGLDSAESLFLDPRTQGTQGYLQSLFSELATKYNPTGFWIDFLDSIPEFCIANHSHDYATFGAGLKASLDAIKATILQNVANPVVYNRSTYANLTNKTYANVWQPTDSPNDYDLMRTRALQMRPFSRGTVFASDEMYWDDTADDAAVSKFVMTAMMVGMPSLGGDIVHSSETVRQIVGGWINFYRQYQSDFMNGQFEPFGTFRVPNHKIETPTHTIAYLRNLDMDVLPAQGTQAIHILNATDYDELQLTVQPPPASAYLVQTFDRYQNLQDTIGPLPLNSDGTLSLDIYVEQGGSALLTPAGSQ